MLKPLAHQEKFVKGYSGPRLLVHEGGSGKTICACLWLRDGRNSDALVVCPKKVVKKWQKALSDWSTRATVLSMEQFKKAPLHHWSAIVVDEADEFASPLYVAKKRSQRSTSLYNLLNTFPDLLKNSLLLTATPVRSSAWNLHSLLVYIGIYIDWKVWRDKFFYLQYPDGRRYSFLARPAYMPRDNWREMIKDMLPKYADIVLLRDCVGELPPVTEEFIDCPAIPKFKKFPDYKPFFDEHRYEQQNKVKEILEIGKGFRKVLVVAYYREQIEQLEKELSKNRQTFAIHGGVKDQEAIIEQANTSDECFFCVQAGIGAGFDADTFSAVVFASMSYAVRDYVQMKFRVRRIHNLHPVSYYYLMGGRCDHAVFTNVQLGRDFVPSEWRDND